MNVDGTPFRTIWRSDDGWSVEIIDQTKLPHKFIIKDLYKVKPFASVMWGTRRAPFAKWKCAARR